MKLDSQVTEIKGIGGKRSEYLKKLNISTVGELLGHYPRTYQNRTNIKRLCEVGDGEEAMVSGRVVTAALTGRPYGKRQTFRLLIDDGTARCEIIFFNGRFLKNRFKIGELYSFFGKAERQNGRLSMLHPEYFDGACDETTGILPVYPLSSGLTQSDMRKWQKIAGELIGAEMEYLPEKVLTENKLCPLDYAMRNIHFPQGRQQLAEARYRLIFDELLLLQLGLILIKNDTDTEEGISFDPSVRAEEFTDRLPYALTGAQQRVVDEIFRDMESQRTMNRLVQGDVGSGKTAVAEIALYKAVRCGYQGVMMAPTEILARQHYGELCGVFEPLGIRCGFLGGSMPAKEKREVLRRLAAGEIDVLTGTHALIQPEVEFKNLGLVITDEQHRFGVNQRRLLAAKGKRPDTLVMTATPIPRTLAVILYGDLDISIIDELPAGRIPIITKALEEKDRIKAYEFMRQEARAGAQVYVVAPLIEDSESMDVRSAEGIYEELCESFKELRIALLHGEMKQAEKEAVMLDFKNGEIDVLVSTVVIEVGINVPNATVMIVENAERFGLAQLHQLRGRVGRGSKRSYCMLITEGSSEVAARRAEIMASSSDGFVISEKDLELRGPGEFFGTRQHGIPELKIANLAKHGKIIAAAQTEAKRILRDDPRLSSEDNRGLRRRLGEVFPETFAEGQKMQI